MLPQNKPDRIRILFDDHRLVANAGLLLPATLARHPGLGRWGRTRRLAPDHRPGLDHLRDLWTGQGGSAPPRLYRRPRLSPAAGHCRRHRRGADVPAARGPGQHRPWRRPLLA